MDTAASSLPPNPTPILDRTTPLPPPAKLGIGSVVARVLLLVTLIMMAKGWDPQPGRLVLQVLGMVLCFVIGIAIHEAAHAFIGKIVGFRTDALRISRLLIDRPLRISIYRGVATEMSGWANMTPVKENALALRGAVMILAGPAANLLTAFALTFVPLSKAYLSYSLFLWSLYFAFANLLPFRTRDGFSDGMRVLMLLLSRRRSERWVAIMKLTGQRKEDATQEDLSSDLFEKAIAIKDRSADTVRAYLLAYQGADNEQDDTKAAEYLEVCLQYSSYAAPALRQLLIAKAVIFQATRHKRVDLAEQWLADLPAKTESPWLRANIEVAIRETNGDFEGALKQLEVIEKLVLALPEGPRRDDRHRSLLRWKSELQSKLCATPQAEEQA